jgi:hypothetical protein
MSAERSGAMLTSALCITHMLQRWAGSYILSISV